MSKMPSSNEQEYFARAEATRLRKAAEERDKQIQAAEKEQLKKLHWMKCPKDGMDMVEIQLAGVHVDKCFTCDGVFFDAGELDQVVKKEAGFLGRFNSIFGRGK